jgi:leucyl aminopeptidase
MAKIKKAQKQAVKRAIKLAVRLGDLPGNLLTPTIFAQEAEEVARASDRLTSTILGEREMEELGMGLLLGVSQGSDEEAKLIVVEYEGGGDFLINGRATKPGDVHTGMDGTRVEILNTDAEGRLILADALTYVQDTFNPRAIIDVATLTGAAIYALGSYYTCVLGNDKAMAKAVIKAGKKAKDLGFRLPMHPDVADEIKHKNPTVADLKNLGNGPGPGTTTAAAFLNEFVDEDIPYVHLDVAATASTGDTVTGRPVGMLVQFLVDESEKV